MGKWQNIETLPTHNYTCGYCGRDISSNVGYYNYDRFSGSTLSYIYICHHCGKPTYVTKFPDKQVPGPLIGTTFDPEIFGDDQDIFNLYEEARRCFSIGAYTSVGLCCRKLLMHIAVYCDAEENKSFKDYVNYLSNNNYIPINAKKWVDIIRSKGNEANHDIVILNESDARALIGFIQVIIDVVFRMNFEANQYLSEK